MSDRYRAGLETLLEFSAEKADLLSDALAAEAPEFVRLLVEFVFADLFGRTGLDRRTRVFVGIGALAGRGDAPNQLRWFVRAALEGGARREEIIEALMQVAALSGFPNAAKALEACADLLADQADSGCDCPPAIVAR